MINTFVEATRRNMKCTKNFKPKQPLPRHCKGEREAIKELSKREDIIITNADKEGLVVIVDPKEY